MFKKRKSFHKILKSEEYNSLNVGIMFPVSICVGLGIGYLLDELFNSSPYLLIVFMIYGIIAGFVNLYRVAKKSEKKNK